MQALALSDLRAVAGQEPRIHDLRLAEALGFQRPRAIRQVLVRNASELARYGEVSATIVATGPRGGRPSTEYWLNEGQALLICMFSETARAADVRQQLIEVFMAWRRGQLPPAPRPDQPDAFTAMAERLSAIEAAIGFRARNGASSLAESVTHLPVWGNGRRPKFWADTEVRNFLTEKHRLDTMANVLTEAAALFGWDRLPSMSSLGRYWQLLDRVRGSAAPGKLH